MNDKLNQFVENTQGQFIEVSSKEALYQCMDLAYIWVFCLGFPKVTIQNQYAYQVFTSPKEITHQYFDIVANTPDGVPPEGSLIIWSNQYGPAGHIAIVISANKTKFTCFEQNNPLGTNAHIEEHSYSKVLGWLVPKIPVVTPPDAPQWLKGLAQENGVDLANLEGWFREMLGKAKDRDNATQDRDKALKNLAEARGDVTKFEELYLQSNKELVNTDKLLKEANAKNVEKDIQIADLKRQLESCLQPPPEETKNWIIKLIEFLTGRR